MNEERIIAEVYPVKRLPRRFSVFDYLLPSDVTVATGSFVSIPWRQTSCLGVVKAVRTKRVMPERLKSLSAIVDVPKLTELELAWYESLAYESVQSVCSVLYAAIPEPPKRARDATEPVRSPTRSMTIRANETATLTRLLRQLEAHRRAFIQAMDVVQMAALVEGYRAAHPTERVAVIAPTVREAQMMAEAASDQAALVTGEEPPGRLFQSWKAWRQGACRLLIGTRRAAFALSEDTHTVFFFRSGHQSHAQTDQNPRLDLRDAAFDLVQRVQGRCYFLDVAPRADDLHSFGREQMVFHNGLTFRVSL